MNEQAEKVEPLPPAELETQPMSKMDVRPSQTNQFRKDPLRVYCLHQTDEDDGRSSRQRSSNQANPFEVVPDHGDGVDIVHIAYGGDKTLKGPEELELVSEQEGKKVYTLECRHEGILERSFVSRDFWKRLTSANTIEVKGGNRNINVKAYPPGRHCVAFEFPELDGIEGGRKIGEKGEKSEKEKNVDNTRTKKNSWKSWEGIEPPDSDTYESDTPPPIRYSVDGEPVEQNVLELAGAILELGKRILRMYRTVRDNVPKVGWYFKADFQLMDGVLNLAWEWKEYHDHRAFLWIGVMLDIDILSVSVEIGAGVEGFGFTFQLYGKLDGSLGITESLKRSSPDMDREIEVHLDAEIKGTIGGRFRAGNSVEAVAKLQTALEFSGGFTVNTDEGMSIETGIEWTGLAGVVVGSVGFIGVHGYEKEENYTVIEESDLGTWKWPKESPYEPEGVSNSEMKSILEENLDEGFFDKTRVKTDSGEYVGTSALASILTRKIDGTEILRDKKTIEALSHDIKQRLEQIESGGWVEKDALSYNRFKTFCDQELPVFLDDYVDPMVKVQDKMCSGAKS